MPSPLYRFPKHLNALGMIVVEMAALEANFVLMLQSILGVSEDTAIALLMAQLSTRGRIETVKHTALSRLNAEEYEMVKTVADEALNVLNKRNDLIHNVWGTTKDKKKVIRIVGIGKPNKEVPLSELEQMISRLETLSSKVLGLCNRFKRMRSHYNVNISHDI